MAYQYRIEPDRRLAVLTFTGPLDGAELVEATERLYHDPAWAYGFDALWDFRDIKGLHLDVGHLPALVALDRRFADVAGPGADLLVTAKDFHHALARLHAHLSRSGPRNVIAARSMEEAQATLGRVRAERARPTPKRGERAP
jgi:hypothetical protein